MSYIVDLGSIRGEEDEVDKVSKLLIYSQHLEMQMYYIDENHNAPVLLFTGNIMSVYTKLALAIQKYHATTLVLLSENLEGQEHSSLGNVFRFHTKMYRSKEYFVSNNNNDGRTLNSILSVEINTCQHFEMLFGSAKRLRIVSEINSER